MSVGIGERAGVTRPIRDSATLGEHDFKAVFRQHAAGVAVVALRDGDVLVGFSATSVISVSARPPQFAFSVASTSSSWPALSRVDTVAVSFLAEHQAEVSARFATHGIDRFAAGGWTALPTGEPVIDGAQAWLRGAVEARLPVGDSFLIVLRAVEHGISDGTQPLIYRDRAYHGIGPVD